MAPNVTKVKDWMTKTGAIKVYMGGQNFGNKKMKIKSREEKNARNGYVKVAMASLQ